MLANICKIAFVPCRPRAGRGGGSGVRRVLGLELVLAIRPCAWDSRARPTGLDAVVTLGSDAQRGRLWPPRMDPGPPSGIGGCW